MTRFKSKTYRQIVADVEQNNAAHWRQIQDATRRGVEQMHARSATFACGETRTPTAPALSGFQVGDRVRRRRGRRIVGTILRLYIQEPYAIDSSRGDASGFQTLPAREKAEIEWGRVGSGWRSHILTSALAAVESEVAR